MDDLRTILGELEDKELSFVMARSHSTKDKIAYESAGYASSTWFDVSKERRAHLVELAGKIKAHRTIKALMILDENAEIAAQTIANLMGESDNDNVRLNAAKDILDRTTGKPAQKVDNTHAAPNGGPVEVKHSADDITASILSKLAGIAAASATGEVPVGPDSD